MGYRDALNKYNVMNLGGLKDGSLRVIRNGIGIHELASIDELPANTIKVK